MLFTTNELERDCVNRHLREARLSDGREEVWVDASNIMSCDDVCAVGQSTAPPSLRIGSIVE